MNPNLAATRSRRPRGFTLIEVLLVLVILVVLASLAVLSYGPIMKRVKVDQARTQIGSLKQAVDLYNMHMEEYPKSLDDLRRDPGSLPPGKWYPIMDRDIPLDPWKNQYSYKYPGDHNPDSFDIWTVTPDNQMIGNWSDQQTR